MSKSPLTIKPDGTVTWKLRKTDKYLVTGVDRNGRRFRQQHSSWLVAKYINVWRGTKWLIRGGKRYVIQRIYN
jgi:hypothetical protein